MTVSDRGEHVLSELLLLQRARCVRPERASVAHMDQLQQRCKQRRLQRSHSSMVQLGVTSGDMRSRVTTWLDGPDGAVPLRARLKVLFSNAFELEVEQGTVGMLSTSLTRSAGRRRRAGTGLSICGSVLKTLLGGWYE